ncbi:MAG: transcription factor that binds to CRE motif [Bogoriella megaspora]|nr:MAG: transcription factor that binds to CRE motif [Bogoriella megaspora]
MDAFHAASLISPSDSNLSYTYSPNTISPQALEMLEHSQQDVKTGPKKRKSWGQVLPEPKTNLPPRKRAKTEDEKEQRRIERVKRNRLAAHNSRERKRAEVDQLTQEKQCLEAQMQNMQVRMNQMHAQLLHYQKIYGVQGLEGSIMSSPPVKDDLDFEGDSAYNSSSTSTIDPREASFSSPGPSDMSTPQTHIEDYESHPPAIKADNVVRPAVSVGNEQYVDNTFQQTTSAPQFQSTFVMAGNDGGLSTALPNDNDYLDNSHFDDFLDLSGMDAAKDSNTLQQQSLHSNFEDLFPGMESITPLSSLEKSGASFPFFADAGFGATNRDEPGMA